MPKSRSTPKPAAPARPAVARPGSPATPMTPAAAARIQSATARQHGGQTPPDSFAARAQRAAARGSEVPRG